MTHKITLKPDQILMAVTHYLYRINAAPTYKFDLQFDEVDLKKEYKFVVEEVK